MKVILPNNNDWLDIYFNTRQAYFDKSKLKRHPLEEIIEASCGQVPEYEVEFEDRTNGQYFIIETEDEKKWITVSADYTIAGKEYGGSNNAYFAQVIPMALESCYSSQTRKNKKLELYLKGITHPRATNNGQIFYYRIAMAIGVKILNYKSLNRIGQDIPREIEKGFTSISDWKLERIKNKKRNTSNNSSQVVEQEESYIFYGKTFGANGRESIFILTLLAQLAKKENKKLYLNEVTDNGTTALESSIRDEDKKFKRYLESFGVIYYLDSVEEIEQDDYEKEVDDEGKDSRNQAEFIKNLLQKYNAVRDENGVVQKTKKGRTRIKSDMKKCYLCGCTLQKVMVASHIQRVCDINKLRIPFAEKRKKAVDPDNGLWLCATHDKMFEYGDIYFEGNKLVISDKLNEEQVEYIKSITYPKINKDGYDEKEINVKENEDGSIDICIPDRFYNENMHEYLEIHRKRVNKV